MPDDTAEMVKVQCDNCNSVLVTTMDELKAGLTCRFCGEKLTLVRVMVNSDTGAVIHMFECPCGERIWID